MIEQTTKNKMKPATIVISDPAADSLYKRWRLNPWVVVVVAVLATLAITGHRVIVDLPSETTFGTTLNTVDASNCTNEESSFSLSAKMGLNGNVSECCCSFTEIEDANIAVVRPLLDKIVQTPFFSHFKIDLCSECELWEDQPLCILRDCGVCECEQPPAWAFEVDGMPPTGPNCKHLEDEVITTVDSHVSSGWQSAPSSFLGEPLVNAISNTATNGDSDSDNGNTAVVVDLRLNPEHYTGYSGPSAAKVWTAIHSTNCFQPSSKAQLQQQSTNNHEGERTTTFQDEGVDPMDCILPAEQRLYNRFISGLHSSISLHIANTYCLEMDPLQAGECQLWGTHSEIAHERVLDHPDRVENMYVAFALLLRAVVKAGPAVTAAVPRDDPFFADSLSNWTDSLLPELTKMAEDCPKTFDESNLLLEPGFALKKVELQRRFQHLQQIIKCVGCDRCKLWGTLQTLGIGTAMRVLFHDNEEVNSKDEGVVLSRQEAVALVHTLERLSSSLVIAHELRRRAGSHVQQTSI